MTQSTAPSLTQEQKQNKEGLQTLQKILMNSTSLNQLCTSVFNRDADFFVKQTISTIVTSDQSTTLINCDRESILKACIKSAQLGLPIDATGYAYLVPRWDTNDRCNKASLQIGYKGLLALARRNPKVKNITAFVVYKDEYNAGRFVCKLGTEMFLEHNPDFTCNREDSDIFLLVATISFEEGGFDFKVMTKSDIEKRKAVATTEKFWNKWYVEMAKKTVLRNLLKDHSYLNIIEEEEEEVEEGEGINTPIRNTQDNLVIDNPLPTHTKEEVCEEKDDYQTIL